MPYPFGYGDKTGIPRFELETSVLETAVFPIATIFPNKKGKDPNEWNPCPILLFDAAGMLPEAFPGTHHV